MEDRVSLVMMARWRDGVTIGKEMLRVLSERGWKLSSARQHESRTLVRKTSFTFLR